MPISNRQRILATAMSGVMLAAMSQATVATAYAQEATQGDGSVSGQVVDANGRGISGVIIKVDGTRISVSTNRDGSYRLSNVPAGSQNITARAIGYEGSDVAVAVTSGGTASLDFSLSLTIEEIAVLGSRIMGQSRALNEQRSATNIKNVVAADQIGSFPDYNIAEATARVSGIALIRDDGEGENLVIRGLSPALNSITLNGERMPSTDGNDRTLDFIQISSDLLEAIEVSKVLRPDIDEDAIGGQVNLVTKQAPTEAFLNARIEYGYTSLRKEGGPKLGFAGGTRFGADDEWGVIGSFSYQNSPRGNDTLVAAGINDITGTPELNNFQLRYGNVLFSKRYSGNFGIDRDFDDGSSVYANYILTQRDQGKTRHRARIRGMADGEADARREVRNRFRKRRTQVVQAGGEKLFESGAVFDAQVSWAESFRDEPRTTVVRFQEDDAITISNLKVDGEDYFFDMADEDPSLSGFEFVETDLISSTDTHYGALANLELPVSTGSFDGTLKFGAKYKTKEKSYNETVTEYEDDDGVVGSLAANADSGLDGTTIYNGRFNLGTFPSIDLGQQLIDGGMLTKSVDIESNAGDYNVTEEVFAAYAMFDVSWTDQLSTLGGFRFHHTSIDGTGNSYDEVADTISATSATSSYSDILPYFMAKFEPKEDHIFRAAITQTIARPSFSAMIPREQINREDFEVSRGNPDLKAAKSTNIDLLFERYFPDTVGVFQAGLFYKNLANPVVGGIATTIDIDGDDYTLSQPVNGNSATIKGAEVAYQQQLTFLPGFWSGFGINVNATYTKTDVHLEGSDVVRSYPNQPNFALNTSVSYESNKFSTRLSWQLTDEYVNSFQSGRDRLVGKHSQFDFSANYDINDHAKIYVNWNNIFSRIQDQFYRTHSGNYVPYRVEDYGTWGAIGLRLIM